MQLGGVSSGFGKDNILRIKNELKVIEEAS
jgi:hypothetical protein